MMSLFKLSKYIVVPILTEWLKVDDIVTLDSAICNEIFRTVYISWIKEFPKLFRVHLFPTSSVIPLSIPLFQWAKRRGMHLQNILNRIFITDSLIKSFRYNDYNSKYVEYFRCVKYLRIEITAVASLKLLLVILPLFSSVEELVYQQAETTIVEVIAMHCWKLRICNLSESKNNLKESAVIAICMNCPHLTSLDVSYCKLLSSGFIRAVAIYARKLVSLNISMGRNTFTTQDILLCNIMSSKRLLYLKYCGWTDITLNTFLSYRGNTLQVLKLADNKSISDEILSKVGTICPNITDVNVSYCTLVTDEGIVGMIRKLQLLKSLNLEGLVNITNVSLRHINTECNNLKTIYLHNNIKINEEGLYYLRTTLQKITISWMVLTNEYLKNLALQCTELLELNIRLNYNISNHAIIDIAPNLKQILKLNLSFCDKIGNSSMSALGKYCKKLMDLDVKHCELISNDGVLSILNNCNDMCYFDIAGCKLVTISVVDKVNLVNGRGKRFR